MGVSNYCDGNTYRMFRGAEYVFINIVLFSDDGRKRPKPRQGREPLPEPTEYYCLLRATCKSKKISTVVSTLPFLIFHGHCFGIAHCKRQAKCLQVSEL